MGTVVPNQVQHIQVEAQADHLDSIARSKPINALAELIWNSLDADANKVEVTVEENKLSGLERVLITDDGDGLPLDEASAAFGKLGGSWKKGLAKTRRLGRGLHGREGKGRFKAFALGSTVVWDTTFEKGGRHYRYTITGKRGNLKAFDIEPLVEVSKYPTGTAVTIENLAKNLGSLREDGPALDNLSEQFAIYLRDNPSIKIVFRGMKVDPSRVQKAHKDIFLGNLSLGGGKIYSAILEIFEWTTNRKERKIRLCDDRGMTLSEVEAGVRPGGEYNFTAYLRSAFIGELQQENLLELGEQTPGLKLLLETARDYLRGYFRERKALSAGNVVRQWKDDGIYPFSKDPQSPIDKAHREVFDICAVNVHEYMDSFRQGSLRDQKFTLLMLKTTLDENPPALKRILTEVLGLPKDRQRDLAELLESHSLPAVIEAAKIVSDRLTFLAGLEKMLFDPQSKQSLEERNQLHKILETETWIFGEEFFLTESEMGLSNVLRKHLGVLRPEEFGRKRGKAKPKAKVLLDDESEGRIDLLLTREIPTYGRERKEFLVVELKRPSQKVDLKVKAQIEGYALALMRDEQIDTKHTYWTFLAVSNELSDDATETIEQNGKPLGYFMDKPSYRVGLASWAEIIRANRTRLELFKESIGKGANAAAGVRLLNAKYQKYIPDCIIKADDQLETKADPTQNHIQKIINS